MGRFVSVWVLLFGLDCTAFVNCTSVWMDFTLGRDVMQDELADATEAHHSHQSFSSLIPMGNGIDSSVFRYWVVVCRISSDVYLDQRSNDIGDWLMALISSLHLKWVVVCRHQRYLRLEMDMALISSLRWVVVCHPLTLATGILGNDERRVVCWLVDGMGTSVEVGGCGLYGI